MLRLPWFRTQYPLAYDPELVPPPRLMHKEGIDVIEEWFRWGEEWSMLLRVYGAMGARSAVLEIGCGLGRVAFPLRFILTDGGTYDGFEICDYKVEFLQQNFQKAYPNFRFVWADVHNTYYNPRGRTPPSEYRFPYDAASFDLVFAASVFTHMLPEATARYFSEAARVLRPGGRALFSCFLLDHYRHAAPRPHAFAGKAFDFAHAHGAWGDDFRTVVPRNPEQMTAYRLSLLQRFASAAGLELAQPPLPGLWSGTTDRWIGAQDLLILRKSG